jgi:hypothetical protein
MLSVVLECALVHKQPCTHFSHLTVLELSNLYMPHASVIGAVSYMSALVPFWPLRRVSSLTPSTKQGSGAERHSLSTFFSPSQLGD